MGKSMSDQLSMFDQRISEDSDNAISSPGSGDGRLPFDSPDGPTTEKSGRGVAPVSRGQTPTYGKVAAKATPIPAIFGLRGSGSGASAAVTLALQSRLRRRFGEVGWTKCSATWNRLITPAGRLVCLRAVSEQIMGADAYGGWPTPTARDGKDISRSNAFLSQRRRHSPSLATRLLERGAPWQVITAIYCLAMGYPSSWNETRLGATETALSRKSRQPSSRPISTPEASK